MPTQIHRCEKLRYTAGLDEVEEPVISSHFMHKFVANSELKLYEEDQFNAKLLEIDAKTVDDSLIPALFHGCKAFCEDRANRAKHGARRNHREYGLNHARDADVAQFVTEVMFDRQYVGPRKTCSRRVLCNKVKERIEAGRRIQMVIPALPFKFSSPLKTRGRLPDLAEVNFILGLYEIAATIELIYKEARPDLRPPLAAFTVVSDGSRFNHLVGEDDSTLEQYRTNLDFWIQRLGLREYVTILDYRALIREKLPVTASKAIATLRDEAQTEYANTLWPIFDPCDMGATMQAAATIEPDPESSNSEGRFVAVLKSIVYTINYKALKNFEPLPAREYTALYRDLIAHIFEPYAILSDLEIQNLQAELAARSKLPSTNNVKECLRQAVLREAWSAAIEYMAEIKSARELDEDLILTCLPDHFRWTIHAKSGQVAILTSSAFGIRVQPWAGTALFKLGKGNKIKLCTLPVFVLEGFGAIPVKIRGANGSPSRTTQPFFYIHPDIAVGSFDDFISRVMRFQSRKRRS